MDAEHRTFVGQVAEHFGNKLENARSCAEKQRSGHAAEPPTDSSDQVSAQVSSAPSDSWRRVAHQLELAWVRREAERRVTSILDSMSDGIQLLDAEWRVTYMNPAARKIVTAQALDPDAMMGRHVFDELFPELRDTDVGQRMQYAMAERVSVCVESYDARSDEWYLHRFDPLSDGGLASTFRPITTQKRAEQAQRRLQRERDEALARLQLQFERMPIACFVTDAEIRIVDCNPAAEALFGFARADIVGRKATQLLVPQSRRERIAEIVRRVIAGDMNAHSINENVTQDGRTIICEWHNTPLRAACGEFVGILSMAQDVTERTRAEAALHASEERFRLVTEAFAGCVYDWRASTNRIQFFGDTANLLGWRPPEMPDDPRWWKDRIHPADAPSGLHASQFAVQSGATGWSVEYRVQHRDGHYVDVAEGARIIRDGDGAVLRVVGGLRDISARRTLERERELLLERERDARAAAETAAAARREAEQALAWRAAELERSNAELARFASIASHDLQEPMRTVASFVKLLAVRYRDQLDDRAGRWIDFTLRGVEHMQRLISGLLALAQVRSDDSMLVPTDTAAALARTWESLCSARSLHDAQLLHGPLPVVLADARHIEQLFQNLLGNAIKYRQPAVPLAIHVSAERHAAEAGVAWEFTVRDNGIGLDMAQADRIFDLFHRLHVDEHYEGAGIGLAICKKIVEHHGGRIWVVSAPGAGATFHFTIPERSG